MTPRSRSLALGMLLSAVAGSSFAATIYVSNDPGIVGTRDGLTEASAFATISEALTLAASVGFPGSDEIRIAGGFAPYKEANLINSPVTLIGTGTTKPVIETPTGVPRSILLRVSADNVTIDNIEFRVIYGRFPASTTLTTENGRAAIANYAVATGMNFFGPASGLTFNNLLVQNCEFSLVLRNSAETPTDTGQDASSTGASFRTLAIGLTNTSAGANDVATLRANVVKAGAALNDSSPTFFFHGFSAFATRLTIGGATPADGNTIQTGYMGVYLNNIATGGTTTVRNNTLTGLMGVEVSNTSGGTYNITENTFNPATLFDAVRTNDHLQSILINSNANTSNANAINITNNQFFIPPMNGNLSAPVSGIYAGGSKFTNIIGNTFQPRAGNGNLRGVRLDTNYQSADPVTGGSGNPSQTNQTVVIRGNTFIGGSTPGTKIGIDIRRTIDRNGGYGTFAASNPFTVGGAGADANTFSADLTTFINYHNPSPTATIAVTQNMDGRQNLYDVGSGAKLPSAMTEAELALLEGKLFHKLDNGDLGLIRVVDGALPANPSNDIGTVITAASDDEEILLGPGTYSMNGTAVNKRLTIRSTQGAEVTRIVNPGAALFAMSVAAGDKNVTIRDLSFEGYPTAILTGNGTSGRQVVVEDSIFTNNGSAVDVFAGNNVIVRRNAFIGTTTGAVRASGQAASLSVTANAFFNDNAYYVRPQDAPGYTAPAAAFSGNWYESSFDVDANANGIIDGLNKVVGAAGTGQTVTDNNVIAQFDRDGDGIPDAVEIALGTTDFKLTSTNGSEVDGTAVGTNLNLDTDGDGYPDWYENNRKTNPNSAASKPNLGDVVPNGVVGLADAVRALQMVNNAVPLNPTSGNLSALNVTGRGYTSLANPLQLLRFQAGLRAALPAIDGVN